MKAIIARDQAAGVEGLELGEMPYPHAAENDVVVRVHAAGFTPGELDWPGTWTDRAGRERTPTIPGHEVAGVVAELGYGTTGLAVGQRVFGVTDWCRNGTLAEYVAVEARNLAPLSDGVDVGARVIGTGRAAHRQTVLGLGADAFVDLEVDQLEGVGKVDVVLDVMGGEILQRSAALVRSGGTLVSIAEPPPIQPENGRAVFFVVEPDRAGLAELELRLRDGRLRPVVGTTYALEDAPAAFDPTRRSHGKPIIRVAEGDGKTE
jgi:NADPH:quinone reductase-like Zn-dependent oxidoreductase